MQTANALLALAGDRGNTVPKYNVTPAEVAVLRVIHGEEAVFDIEPQKDIDRASRAELTRLNEVYGRARVDDTAGNKVSAVGMIFPGAAARVFEDFDELELPDEFFKATERAKPAPSAPKAKATKQKAEAKAEAKTVEEVPEQPAGDGVEEMEDKLFS